MVTTPNPGKPLWPANFQGCTISGKYIDSQGNALAGSVIFLPSPAMFLDVAANTIIVPQPVEVVLDINGSFSVVLPATDDPDVQPVGWTYHVTESIKGGRTFDIAAPQNTAIDLVSASPIPASGGSATVIAPAPIRVPYGYGGILAPKVGAAKFYNDSGRTVSFSAIRASVGTAPTGASIICDVKKNGTSIFNATPANRPTIPAGQTTALAGGPDTPTWAPGEYLTVDIVQVGSTVAGADLVLQVYAT